MHSKIYFHHIKYEKLKAPPNPTNKTNIQPNNPKQSGKEKKQAGVIGASKESEWRNVLLLYYNRRDFLELIILFVSYEASYYIKSIRSSNRNPDNINSLSLICS